MVQAFEADEEFQKSETKSEIRNKRAINGREVAKANGVKFGHKSKLIEHQQGLVLESRANGDTYRQIAKDLGISHSTKYLCNIRWNLKIFTEFNMRYSLTKIIRYAFSFLLALLLTGCGGHEKIDFLHGSFSGNGKLFSYSRVKNEIASIYITNSDGTIVKMVGDGTNSSYQGAFLDGAFYYVEYSGNIKESKIIKCDADASNCRKIYNSPGSVKCLFNYRNRLHFYQSSYNSATHGDSGYVNYAIKSVAFDGQDEMTHFGGRFAINFCPVKMNDAIYSSIIFPFEFNMTVDKNKNVIWRYDSKIIPKGNYYFFERDDIKIERSISIQLNISDLLSYVAINYDGRYRYGLCGNIHTCEIEIPTTNPVYIDGVFYYGIWDNEHEKIQILKWL